MAETQGREDHVISFMRLWLSLSWIMFLWSLTLTVVDVQHVAENAEGSLKWLPRMCQLCDVFVKPRGMHTLRGWCAVSTEGNFCRQHVKKKGRHRSDVEVCTVILLLACVTINSLCCEVDFLQLILHSLFCPILAQFWSTEHVPVWSSILVTVQKFVFQNEHFLCHCLPVCSMISEEGETILAAHCCVLEKNLVLLLIRLW